LDWGDFIHLRGIHHFDMDNDGDDDVFSFVNNAGQATNIFRYENTSTGLGTPAPLEAAARPIVMTSGDLDGDGFEDIVYASFSQGLFWCKNIAGSGSFEAATSLSGPLSSTRYCSVADLDNDQDLDIVAVLTNSNNVIWIENLDGLASFGTPQVISDQLENARSVAASDFDQDGASDIVATGVGEGEIIIFNNLLFSPQISGYAFYDANQNAVQEATESGLQFNNILLEPNALATYSSINGAYLYTVEDGEYIVSATTPENWQLSTPNSSYAINIQDTILADLNFGFYPTVFIDEVRPTLNSSLTRCDWEVPFWLHYENTGTTTVSGEIKLVLPDNVDLAFNDAEQIVNDTIIWTINDLAPTLTQTIYLTLQMPDVESQGDLLTFESIARVYDENDQVIAEATHTYESILLCAYDPNDKLVEPQGVGVEGLILADQELQYTIRFQNTGNDTAFTVRLEDQLDNELDWSTFSPVAASHDFTTTLNDQGLVTFLFEDIQLVDSTTNEIGSHGFITYRIYPLPNLAEGSVLENNANIFFDSNPPIITNTTINTIGTILDNTEDLYNDQLFLVYPNPTKDHFSITYKGMRKTKVELIVTNIQGQRIYQERVRLETDSIIDIHQWPSGIYLLEIKDNNGLLISK
ncbi:MAG: FG-GAP-like repeat-containing protein, partial [Bacteroidota bacterium]